MTGLRVIDSALEKVILAISSAVYFEVPSTFLCQRFFFALEKEMLNSSPLEKEMLNTNCTIKVFLPAPQALSTY